MKNYALKFYDFLTNKVGLDRALHFALGGWIIAFDDTLVQLIILIIISVGKESFDKLVVGEKFDKWDLVSTLCGGLLAILLDFII